MKKIFTSLCLITYSLLSFGQFSVECFDDFGNNVTNTFLDVSLPANASITTEVLVYNSDSVSHTYKCRREVWTVASDDSTQFCWGGLCYNWGTDLSSMNLTIAPFDTVHFSEFGFHAIFKSKMSSMTRLVHYRFYDIANVNDSTGVTIRYNSTLGVDDVAKADGSISNAWPNPASAFVTMKYDINEYAHDGRIMFHDMLGKKVKEVVLEDKKGTAKIDVDDLTNGIYFYSFVLDGKAIATRKLVVSSK